MVAHYGTCGERGGRGLGGLVFNTGVGEFEDLSGTEEFVISCRWG